MTSIKLSAYKDIVWLPALVILMAAVIGIVSVFDYKIALLFVIVPPALLVMIYRPYYGVLAFLCMVPIEAILTTSGGATWLRYLGIGILAIWLSEIALHRRKINFRWPAWYYLIYVGWALISIFWAASYNDSMPVAWTYLQLGLFFILLIDQVNSIQRLKWALTALVVGGMIAVIAGNITALTNSFGERLIVSQQAAPTIYAYPLGYSMILLGIMAMAGKGKVRLFGLIFFILGLFPTFDAGFRGVLLCIAVGLVAGALPLTKNLRSMIAIILVAGLLYGGFNYILSNNLLPASVVSHYTSASFIEGSGRWDIWNSAIEVFLRHPILGLGLGQFSHQLVFTAQGLQMVGTHNDYLDAMVNLGVPGFLFLLLGEGCVLFSLFKIRRSITKQDMIWYSFLIALFAASIVGQNFINLFSWKYSWIIRALIIAAAWNHIWDRSSSRESL